MPPDADARPQTSILVPTFRRPELLRRALRACAGQQGLDPATVEVVVVDNDPAGSAAPVIADLRADWPAAGPALVAVHEPRPGISHARNTALATARGPIVVFLDDDQSPSPGWLAALLATASRSGAGAVFGAVEPDLACAPDDPLRPIYAAYFRRALDDEADGADITDRVAYMGTQNSLFDRRRTSFPEPPFDPDLGRIGGEDSVLLRRLVERGARLAWAPAARVTESVPAARCTVGYLRRRRFRDGQIRTMTCARAETRRQHLMVPVWMGLGTIQAGLGAARWLVAVVRRDRVAAVRHLSSLHGGLGKVAWGRPFRFPMYGGSGGS